MELRKLKVDLENLHKEGADPWDFWKSEYEQRKYAQQMDLVAAHCSPSQILEIGCSTGAHSLRILERFPNATLTAIDISESAIEAARKRLPRNAGVKCCAADLETFLKTSPAAHFDTVFWSEGFDDLHHIYTIAQLSDIIGRLGDTMRNDGILCVSHAVAVDHRPASLATPIHVIKSLHTLLLSYFSRNLDSSHSARKAETNAVYDYCISLYTPIPRFDLPTPEEHINIAEVDVVIPAKDESATVAAVVHAMKQSARVSRVIVVDNNSADSTAGMAEAAGATVVQCTTPGYGAAVKRGVAESNAEWILKIDADIENATPAWADALLETAESDRASMVKSHWLPTLEDPDRVTNFTAIPAIRILFPELAYIKSPLSGVYMFRKDKLDIQSLPGDFSFDVAMLLQAHAAHLKVGQTEIESVQHASVANSKRTLNHYMYMSEQVLRYLIGVGRERV